MHPSLEPELAAGAPPAGLFVRDAGNFVPTDAARGPWDPTALHGGPVAALAAHVAEAAAPEGMEPARLTLELWSAVPLLPLAVSVEQVRPGRRVAVSEVRLRRAGDPAGRVLARGLVQWVRKGGGPAEPPPLRGPWDAVTAQRRPEEIREVAPRWNTPGFHTIGADLRFATGSFRTLGPAFVWIRLRSAVVAGEPTTPFARAVAAADFGNGVSPELGVDAWSYVNPDLSVHLARLPAGEWVGLDAATLVTGNGRGIAESVLYDLDGPIGRAVQGLLVEPTGGNGIPPVAEAAVASDAARAVDATRGIDAAPCADAARGTTAAPAEGAD